MHHPLPNRGTEQYPPTVSSSPAKPSVSPVDRLRKQKETSTIQSPRILPFPEPPYSPSSPTATLTRWRMGLEVLRRSSSSRPGTRIAIRCAGRSGLYFPSSRCHSPAATARRLNESAHKDLAHNAYPNCNSAATRVATLGPSGQAMTLGKICMASAGRGDFYLSFGRFRQPNQSDSSCPETRRSLCFLAEKRPD